MIKSLWFVRHQWKEIFRSNFWQKSLAANIMIGLLMLLMLSYIVMLGMFLDRILAEAFPDDDPVAIVNSVMIYFFIAGLFIRYLMQPLPTLTVESYLHLPIRRGTLVNFVIFKSIFNILNLFPLLLFLPLTFRLVVPENSMPAGLLWLVSIVFMVLANNFLSTWVKRQLSFKPYIAGIMALVLAGVVFLDYYGIISLRDASEWLFGLTLESPLTVTIFLAWMLFTYFLNYRFLSARLYPDQVNNRKKVRVDRLTGARYFESLGLTGEIMTLEIKLWLRHKRTKTMLYMLPVFLLYGLFFYPTPTYSNLYGMFLFVGVFMTGGLMMNYLNYAFGYESGYFDMLLTREIKMKQYIRAKLIIAWMLCSVCYVLTIPYIFFGVDIFWANTAAFLFNLGVSAYALLFMATFNKKRIDLTKGAAFNYQGVGAMNWLSIIPILVLPPLIYLPFGAFISRHAGFAVIGLLGLLGLLLHKFIFAAIFRNFKDRKYVMADGFRQ